MLVILLTHAQALGKHLWLDVGLNSNNTRRYINITEHDKNLGSDMCKALPGLHAFTGCDYTAALMRKGKVCMLAMVEKSEKFQESFGQLGEFIRISSVTMTTLETFVCHIYGKPGILSVNPFIPVSAKTATSQVDLQV